MAKTDILDYSTTPAENQDINGVSILGTAKPSNLDDAQRAQMSHIAKGLVSRRSAKDTAYTAVKADHNQVLDFTETATLTTQAAATLTDGWMCYVYASGGNVTINPNGAETVNGEEFIIVKEGGIGILRVYNGNFLFTGFTSTGGQGGDIVYEETSTTLSSTTTRDVTDIEPVFRAFEIEGEFTSITANPGVTNFQLSVGDGSTWSAFTNPLVRWSNGGTTVRRFYASIHNLDNADLSIFMRTHTDNEDPFQSFITPAIYSARPISALRFRIVPQSGANTLNIRALRVRGLRA